MATSNEQLAELYSRLLTNYTAVAKNYYDIFLNKEPMDVTLTLVEEDGNIVEVTIPNRAKDKTHILSGEGNPELNIAGVLGDLYQDLENGEIYIKKGDDTDTTGWSVLISKEDLDKIIVVGVGNPNGVVSATKGTLYSDRADAVVYIKKTIGGTDGWENIVASSYKAGKGITIGEDNTINAPCYQLNGGKGIIIEDKMKSNSTVTASISFDNPNIQAYCNNPQGFSFQDGDNIKTATIYTEKYVDNTKVCGNTCPRITNTTPWFVLNGKLIKYGYDGYVETHHTPDDKTSALYNTTYIEGTSFGAVLPCVVDGCIGCFSDGWISYGGYYSSFFGGEKLRYASGILYEEPTQPGYYGFPSIAQTTTGKLYTFYGRQRTGVDHLDIDDDSITQIGDVDGGYSIPVSNNGYGYWLTIKNGVVYEIANGSIWQADKFDDVTGTWTDVILGYGCAYGICSGKLYYIDFQYYVPPQTITQVGSATNWLVISGCPWNSSYDNNYDNTAYAYAINSSGDLYKIHEDTATLIDEGGWTEVVGTSRDSNDTEHIAWGIKNHKLYMIKGSTVTLIGDNDGYWSTITGLDSWGSYAYARCTKDNKTMIYKMSYSNNKNHFSPCYYSYYDSSDFNTYDTGSTPHYANSVESLNYNYNIHFDNPWDIDETGNTMTVNYHKETESYWITDVRVKNYFEPTEAQEVQNQYALAQSVWVNNTPGISTSNLLNRRWTAGTLTISFPYHQTFNSSACCGFYMPVYDHINGVKKLVIDGNGCTFNADYDMLYMASHMFDFSDIRIGIEIEIKNMTINCTGSNMDGKCAFLFSDFNCSHGSHPKIVLNNIHTTGITIGLCVNIPSAEITLNNCTFKRGSLSSNIRCYGITTVDNANNSYTPHLLTTMNCEFDGCDDCIISTATITKSINDTFKDSTYGITQSGAGLLFIEKPTWNNVDVHYSNTLTSSSNGIYISD